MDEDSDDWVEDIDERDSDEDMGITGGGVDTVSDLLGSSRLEKHINSLLSKR